MFQKNSYTNYKLVSYKLVSEKYKDTELFTNCIEISCPDGYISIIDDIHRLIKNYNKQYKQKIKFSQVKMKFGSLVVYFENIPLEHTSISYESSQEVLKKINVLIEATKSMCKVCGNCMTDIVINSRILKRCFDHFEVK